MSKAGASPAGGQMNRTAKFWNRMADRYARQPVADEAAYQEKLRITREYLTPETDLLEVGCGTGSTAVVHAPLVRRVRAADFSSSMIAIARDKARAAGVGNIDFEVASLDDLAAADAVADVVLALSVIHLLDDRDAGLRKLYSLLKPGGYLISSTVCVADVMKPLKYVAPLGQAVGLLPLLRVFSADELVRSVSGAGFEIVRDWRPGKKKAVFIVARRPGAQDVSDLT